MACQSPLATAAKECRLFEDRRVEEKFFDEVWDLCARRGVPKKVLKAAGENPYSLWVEAHRWMTAPWWKQLLRRKNHRHPLHAESVYHMDPLHAEITYHLVSKVAIEYEMGAAESTQLFDDVKPVPATVEICGHRRRGRLEQCHHGSEASP